MPVRYRRCAVARASSGDRTPIARWSPAEQSARLETGTKRSLDPHLEKALVRVQACVAGCSEKQALAVYARGAGNGQGSLFKRSDAHQDMRRDFRPEMSSASA